jgi:uncharacterized protein YyaL (SSP411 family)
MARGSVVLDEPKYLDAATLAATAVSTKLWNAKTKTLYRTESHTEALSEDYAMLVQGLVDLFESGNDVKWLDLAMALASSGVCADVIQARGPVPGAHLIT